ncbi:MAG: tyrosine-type recombinase/integrase [Pseudomonadota bacterium]|jgi:site-specific recombinase XerD
MAEPFADSTADLFPGTGRERAEAGALPSDWRSTPLACTLEWLRRQRHDGEPYRPATIQKHLSIVRRYLDSLDRQGSALEHAGPEQIATFLDMLEHLQRDGTPALTRHRYLRTLELLHSELSRTRLRSDNPARALMQQYPAPRTRPLPESLTANEEARLLTALQQAMEPLQPDMTAGDTGTGTDAGWRMLRDAAIVAMAIGSGLQPREIVALGRRDMHLDETPPFVTVAGYGRRPERVAPVSPSVRPLLDAWLCVRARLCADAAGALFCATPRGEPLTVRTVHRACEAWLDRAGIERTHKGARVLRGAFAARQLRAGKPARVLRDWMGLALEGSAAAYARGIVNPDGIEVA